MARPGPGGGRRRLAVKPTSLRSPRLCSLCLTPKSYVLLITVSVRKARPSLKCCLMRERPISRAARHRATRCVWRWRENEIPCHQR